MMKPENKQQVQTSLTIVKIFLYSTLFTILGGLGLCFCDVPRMAIMFNLKIAIIMGIGIIIMSVALGLLIGLFLTHKEFFQE